MAETSLVMEQGDSPSNTATMPLSARFSQLDPLATTTSLRASLKSTEDLKKQRESRAAESLRVKDEQIRILQEQATDLIGTLDRLEDEAQVIYSEKAAIEKENQKLRDNVADFQSRARAAEATASKVQAEISDKEKQLKIITDQQAELLRTLQSEEELTDNQQKEINALKQQLEDAKRKQAALLAAAKSHEEVALRAAREGQLRADEIRVLRAETEQLRQQNNELKIKLQVEVDNLQEHVRSQKEKHYQLLEQLQSSEGAKRQAEDQVTGMEDKIRHLHARAVELETQLQVEQRTRQAFEETNKKLQVDYNTLADNNRELQQKIQTSENERLRMEAQARDQADEHSALGTKMLMLLERLKEANVGKSAAEEALREKDRDLIVLQKKNARLTKECTEEGRARLKAEMDITALQDQVRAVKKHNATLAGKAKAEAKDKLKAVEEKAQLADRMKALEARLAFLLDKVQSSEESKVVSVEERKRMESQIESLMLRTEEQQAKLEEAAQSNRSISQALRQKHEEHEILSAKYDALVRIQQEMEAESLARTNAVAADTNELSPNAPDGVDQVRANDGRGRFYVENKPAQGILVLRGRKPFYRDWLDRHDANGFLKRAQKTNKVREALIEKLATVYGLLMVEEEHRKSVEDDLNDRSNQIEFLQAKNEYAQQQVTTEENAKRRMLLRYVQAVTAHATHQVEVNGHAHHAALQLPESQITDEEVHALVALLRNNTHIQEVNLRGNTITDDGARALAALLSKNVGVRHLDLRGNQISDTAIKILAEALDRNERVQHVYVHAAGKIEAFSTSVWNPHDAPAGSETDAAVAPPRATVEVLCVVDVRDNQPPAPSAQNHLMAQQYSTTFAFSTSKYGPPTSSEPTAMGAFSVGANGSMSASVPTFNPTQLVANSSDSPVRNGKGSSKRSPHKKKPSSHTKSMEQAELRRTKDQLKKEALEGAWQGRQGGLERLTQGSRNPLPPLQDIDVMDEEQRLRAQSAPTSRPATAAHFRASARQAFDDDGLRRTGSRQGTRKNRTDKMDPKLVGSPFLQSIRPKKPKK